MTIQEILKAWVSWDSQDEITVTEKALDDRTTFKTEMSATDLLNSDLADREVKRFGSHGKSPDGKWSHYFEIVPGSRPDLAIERWMVTARLQRAVYPYVQEYLKELANKEKEDAAVKALEEAPDDGEVKMMLLTAENNMNVMLNCVREMSRALEVLRDPEEDVDEWMLAGIAAMMDKINKMKILPFDFPYSVCGLLEAEYRNRKGKEAEDP